MKPTKPRARKVPPGVQRAIERMEIRALSAIAYARTCKNVWDRSMLRFEASYFRQAIRILREETAEGGK